MTYKLRLEAFEGPLDLLLYLIKKNDIDVTDIPINTITEQYMEYIEMMKMLDLEIVGEFLVMAATLMQIKSRMLLPPDPIAQEDEEEDPRDELVRRLQEYKLFKEVAEQLKGREEDRQNYLPRRFGEEQVNELREDAKEVYIEANLFDLISAFTKALQRLDTAPVYQIKAEEYTVEAKIHDILHTLLQKPALLLFDVFKIARCKDEVVVSFMAVLELVRLKEIKLVQKRIFADIEIMRNRDNVIPVSDEEAEAEAAEARAIEAARQAEEGPDRDADGTVESENIVEN